MNEQEQISLEERTKIAVRILSHIPQANSHFLALYILEASSITPKEPLYAALADGFSRCLDEKSHKTSREKSLAVSEILDGMIDYCKEKSGYFGRP